MLYSSFGYLYRTFDSYLVLNHPTLEDNLIFVASTLLSALRFLHYYTHSQDYYGTVDAGFEPVTAASEFWCTTIEGEVETSTVFCAEQGQLYC